MGTASSAGRPALSGGTKAAEPRIVNVSDSGSSSDRGIVLVLEVRGDPGPLEGVRECVEMAQVHIHSGRAARRKRRGGAC